MKKLRLIITLALVILLVSPAAAAQPAQTERKPEDSSAISREFKGRIFELKHRIPRTLVGVLQTLGSGVKGSVITANDEMGIISVRDFPENIAVIEEAIKRLDKPQTAQPRADMEVQLSLVAASRVGGTDSADIPAGVAKVLEQLRNTLKFKSYRYITTFINRTREGGRVNASGAADAFFQPSEMKGSKTFYEYSFTGVNIVNAEGGGQAIQVPEFHFSAKVPINVGNNQIQYQNMGIHTGLTLKDGEQIVVGTSNIGSSDEALIIVVSVKRVP